MKNNKYLLIGFGCALLLALALYLLPTSHPSTSTADQESDVSAASEASGSVSYLLTTADSIRDLLSNQEDPVARENMGKTAISIYEQVLKQEPNNLDAKAGLGFCTAIATPQPMNGIMMLRDVVKADPNHENGQLFLGLLSLQSGQLDKAIDRFEKVLVLDSQNFNVLLILGRTYAETGNTKKALETFKLLKEKTQDAGLNQEADAWIKKLESAS